MPITTITGLQNAARQNVRVQKSATVGNAARVGWGLLSATGLPTAGSLSIGNTSAGVVPTDATAGFPVINAFASGATGYISEARYSSTVISAGTVFDRLWHAGSVSLTTLATTNFSSQPGFTSRLPTTFYGNIELWVEINAAVSNTATTVAIGYMNEAGTTGRSTGAVSVQNIGVARQVEMPLQAGDKGVQRVDSITVGGTVATTGSCNIWLGRRLVDWDFRGLNGQDTQGPDTTGLPIVYADSALHFVVWPDPTNSGRPGVLLTVVNG